MKVDATSGDLVPVISGAVWGGVQVRQAVLFRTRMTQLIPLNSELLFQMMNFRC